MKKVKKFYLKNMVSKSCIKLIEIYFNTIKDIEVKNVFLGEASLLYDTRTFSDKNIIEHFNKIGFETLLSPDTILVEKIKIAAIELVHFANNTNSLIRNSEYISDRIQLPYDKISKVFSSVTGITLEKYLILLKIEKTKELLFQEDYTLSEISYLLGYSSVQYLSNQFKKVTGLTVSQFKNLAHYDRIPLDKLI